MGSQFFTHNVLFLPSQGNEIPTPEKQKKRVALISLDKQVNRSKGNWRISIKQLSGSLCFQKQNGLPLERKKGMKSLTLITGERNHVDSAENETLDFFVFGDSQGRTPCAGRRLSESRVQENEGTE